MNGIQYVVNCAHCGAEIHVTESKVGKNNYCNKDCFTNSRTKKTEQDAVVKDDRGQDAKI